MSIQQLIEKYPEKFAFYVEKILDSYFGNISVFDNLNDEILYANEKMTASVHMTKEEFCKMTVTEMRSKNLWLRSVSNELKEKKIPFDAYNITKWGDELFTHVEPIYNEQGEMVLSVQYSIPKAMIIKFSEYLREESAELEKYKGISEFLTLRHAESEIVLNSPVIKKTFSTAKYISAMDSTILINGETGTGKDVLANYIFSNSVRADKPFVPINCSAIPSELMESEFFGYEKGAFTGARHSGKPGFFEIADGGTLFLDEIGELALAMQAKFLRVLETGEFMRVGGTRPIKTDVRVIAATNRDLKHLVAEGKFREDLYYRLNIMPMYLPPLKDRKEDIIELAELFLSRTNRKYNLNRTITKEMEQSLLEYSWPGNIRELRNVIERYCISGLWYIHAPVFKNMEEGDFNPEPSNYEAMSLPEARDAFEKKYIQSAVERCNGSIAKAAGVLGIHRSLLYKKMEKYGLRG